MTPPPVPLPLAPRRTLINAAIVEGFGLFTGTTAGVTFHPAPAGTGIVFTRVDHPGVAALASSISSTPDNIPSRNTTLRVDGARDVEFITVEHALSALAGLGITDVRIEVRGPELPIIDGSAAPFVSALWDAGLRYAGADIEPLRLTHDVTVAGPGGSRITARPRSEPGCQYTYELDYGPEGSIPAQSASFDTARGAYAKDIAPARTFCTQAEAEAMKKAGLFAHLTARDMLVIAPPPRGPIDNAYRFDNEPARHKLLDLMGDLALVGRPIQADIVAHKSGHNLNHQMARALLAPPP